MQKLLNRYFGILVQCCFANDFAKNYVTLHGVRIENQQMMELMWLKNSKTNVFPLSVYATGIQNEKFQTFLVAVSCVQTHSALHCSAQY